MRSVRRPRYDGVKVFSATAGVQRQALGDRVTHWKAEHPEIVVADVVVAQSSDAAHHCVSICVFYRVIDGQGHR